MFSTPFIIPGGTSEAPEGEITKCGILPFISADSPERYQCYLMRPVASKPHLPPPEWQICKGTRLVRLHAGGQDKPWEDMEDGVDYTNKRYNKESVLDCAIREGNEEIGLINNNIKKIYNLSLCSFSSASSGKAKWMHLFAVTVVNPECWGVLDAATTAACEWIALENMEAIARKDHFDLIKSATYRLHQHIESET